ncbi:MULTISPECIES: DUF4424 domain-containing protein [Alphaproteobacteria]|uniref:DUF4424 domain-containing protein n=2 Tax=Alphaproteobacteria TaxID=28211 RepID=A0A512HF62_9HYPH|nr:MULTISPECIES: DUF4424 domain-containing protein [Alphaproteobacteria]GEO84102.1 hypothetical protein RNA01_10340 [Ciceribacter naphthalenivorans]GLR24638.1 hypothetical protein GCM10007920_44320 [Ciceribacter naphthalenivorans]GLT07494.1 hypothetical protein GCM10007926_44320 [Sphingomonas psychrolutea]
MKNVVLAGLAALTLAAPAKANDTSAVLEAGGLVYTRQEAVDMLSEDLFISPSEVRVDYVFKNQADTDLETLVAFPMPAIGGFMDFNAALDDYEHANFMGFSVQQDGQSIEPNLQQRASVNGIDMTDEIVSRGVSLLPLSEVTRAAIAKLPQDVLKDWETRGLIVNMAYDPDKPADPDYYPLWKLETVYWWRTTFPAGREVKVHHSYKPSVGGTVAMTFVQDGKPTEQLAEYRERYCLDDAFLKTAIKLEKQQDYDAGIYFYEKWMSYILTTGANWGGSIGKFKLTVDKGDTKNYVSFCGENVRKVGPTTFEMTATDFYPEKDLHILLVVPSK